MIMGNECVIYFRILHPLVKRFASKMFFENAFQFNSNYISCVWIYLLECWWCYLLSIVLIVILLLYFVVENILLQRLQNYWTRNGLRPCLLNHTYINLYVINFELPHGCGSFVTLMALIRPIRPIRNRSRNTHRNILMLIWKLISCFIYISWILFAWLLVLLLILCTSCYVDLSTSRYHDTK